MKSSQATEFWAWFQTNCEALWNAAAEPAKLSELDRRIKELGPFSWELGPGLREQHQLAISPRGDADVLSQTKALVAQAPSIPGWEFHPAKQARPSWNLQFSMSNPSKERIHVDASTWRYLYEPEERRLVVEASAMIQALPDDYQIRAVEIALDGLVGEEHRMAMYDELVVAASFESSVDDEARPFHEMVDDVEF